ncbi:MAG: hypothetical protein HZC25_00020 [Rhodospirillales bacterium]|nr:hypothetical protein [Rhodospirillales bacterium]
MPADAGHALMAFSIAALATAVVAAGYAFAGWRLRRARAALPLVIHVAGTRGKSAVVRQIAAGLGAHGLKVMAKTTGTVPMIAAADGVAVSLRRWGAPAIREQESLLIRASGAGVEVLVVECMAVEPDYLRATARDLRADLLVLTNAHPDHQEQLGPEPEAMAGALVNLLHPGLRVIAAAGEGLDPVMAAAIGMGLVTERVAIDPASPHDANRALARAACRAAGADEGRSADGIARLSAADPGAFAMWQIAIAGRELRFADAFACNDVVSLERLWRQHGEGVPPSLVVLATRDDRPLRSQAFLAAIARLWPQTTILLPGPMWRWRAIVRRLGLDPARLSTAWPANATRILAEAAALNPKGQIWGIGNYRGLGAAIGAHLRKEGAPC